MYQFFWGTIAPYAILIIYCIIVYYAMRLCVTFAEKTKQPWLKEIFMPIALGLVSFFPFFLTPIYFIYIYLIYFAVRIGFWLTLLFRRERLKYVFVPLSLCLFFGDYFIASYQLSYMKKQEFHKPQFSENPKFEYLPVFSSHKGCEEKCIELLFNNTTRFIIDDIKKPNQKYFTPQNKVGWYVFSLDNKKINECSQHLIIEDLVEKKCIVSHFLGAEEPKEYRNWSTSKVKTEEGLLILPYETIIDSYYETKSNTLYKVEITNKVRIYNLVHFIGNLVNIEFLLPKNMYESGIKYKIFPFLF